MAYELKRYNTDPKYRRMDVGYNLFYKGKRDFVSLEMLRSIILKFNEKKVDIMNMRASQRGGLKSGDLIIGSQTKNGLSLSTVADPMVHANMSLAKLEAARLASTDKTKKYVILEVKALASVNDVSWE